MLQDVEVPVVPRESVHEGGEFISLMHRLPLSPEDTAGAHFRLVNVINLTFLSNLLMTQ